VISGALIGRELCYHKNDVMVARFVFLFLSRATFREISTEMDVKTVNVRVKKQIDNNFP